MLENHKKKMVPSDSKALLFGAKFGNFAVDTVPKPETWVKVRAVALNPADRKAHIGL